MISLPRRRLRVGGRVPVTLAGSHANRFLALVVRSFRVIIRILKQAKPMPLGSVPIGMEWHGLEQIALEASGPDVLLEETGRSGNGFSQRLLSPRLSGLPTRLPMVVGITSDQTCLVLKNRLRYLQSVGFDVTLVASPGKLLEQTGLDEGVKIWPLPMRRGIALLADMKALIELCAVLIKLRPVITDFSTPKAGLLGNAAAWIARVPCRVYTLRGLRLESSTGWKRKLLLTSEKLAAWFAHRVLCNSASLLERAAELKITRISKLCLLGDGSSNGVDTDRFCPGITDVRIKLGIPTEDLVLGFVGRLTNDKGVPELLLAFELILARQPNSWLLLVGWFDQSDDHLAPRWRSWIADHPRVRHVGYQEDTVPFYRAINVFILPTHREGFPNVILEAAACGLPAITTEVTGARDTVVPDVTGILIPPEQPYAIADATFRLCNSQVDRENMGNTARRWVAKHYSTDLVLRRAAEFYRELIQLSSRARLEEPIGGLAE